MVITLIQNYHKNNQRMFRYSHSNDKCLLIFHCFYYTGQSTRFKVRDPKYEYKELNRKLAESETYITADSKFK